MPPPVTAWFFVVTEEAAPIFKKLMEKGIRPGSVLKVDPEELKILNEGVLYFPVPVRDEQKILVPLAS